MKLKHPCLLSDDVAVFMHISDLHFGSFDPSSLNAANAWWMNLPIMEGFLGHSERAIFRLADRFAELKKLEQARLIVTGDLTTCGNANEFDLFDTYAGADPTVKIFAYHGLRTPGWQQKAIPGNHDHWPGTLNIVGPPDAALYRHFNDLPRISPLENLDGGYRLRFIWINSDIDVGQRSLHRGWARGSCVSHIEIVQTKLPAPVDK